MNDNRKRRPLTAKERKSLDKQRKNAAKQAEKYHKEKAKQDKKAKNLPIQKKDSRKRLLKVKFRRLLLSRKKNRPHKDLPRI